MCFVFTLEQKAMCVNYIKNWMGFITEMESIYSAVRTVPLTLSLPINPLTPNDIKNSRSEPFKN
jgi:hypothetical protein